MGGQRSHERAAERPRIGQHDRTIRHRRLRRTGADCHTAIHRYREVIQHHSQHRARKVLPRQGSGVGTPLLLLHEGDHQPEVQPPGHRHGARRRTGVGRKPARARQHRVDCRHKAHHAQLLALQRPRRHQEQAPPHALRPRQLLVQLQPLAPQQHWRDHRLRERGPVAWSAQLLLHARLQGMGALQELQEQVEVDAAAKGARAELPAAEHRLQLRDHTQLLRAAGARPREHREPQPAHHLQRAVPMEPRLLAAMGPHQEPAHDLPERHTRRDRRALHAHQQRPLRRTIHRMEGLRQAEPQPLGNATRLPAVVQRILPAATRQAAHLRLAAHRRLLQRHLLLAARHGARRRHVAGQHHQEQPQPEAQRIAQPRDALQPHPLPQEDQRPIQEGTAEEDHHQA